MSFLPKVDDRRAIYLGLVGSIESQLRDAYAELHDAGSENQSTIATKLGVGRSVVCKRLTGQQNMTIETLADMVWALRKAVAVEIFDPGTKDTNVLLECQSKSSPVPSDKTTPSACDQPSLNLLVGVS
jgi:hypothetical protein